MKIMNQRNIDEWLKSIPQQMKVLGIIFLTVLFVLTVIGLITDCWEGAINWLFAFINPGSTHYGYSNDINGIALIIGLLSIVLTGVLISVISNIIDLRQKEVEEGKIHYHFHNHVIVIGYNKMCISLIKQISEKFRNQEVEIVVQTVRNVPDVRHELMALLDKETEKNVTLVLGSRTSAEDLEKLHPEHCREIFILGENDEYDHDSLNVRCLELLGAIIEKGKGEQKPCHVLFEYQSTYAIFQQQDIPNIKEYLDFFPFNFHECWAQKVLVDSKFQKITYPFLDREPMTENSDKHVHFVVVGMSQMGVAMGIQAAHICHFPNFITKGIKTKITFIDENADREMNFLKGRYPHFFEEIDYSYQDIETSEKYDNTKSKDKFTDIEFEFIKGRIENPEIQERIKEWANKSDNKLLTIAVCFSHSPSNIAAGLYLPDAVYNNNIPVFVRQETSACTLSLLSSGKYKNVKSFGMLDDVYDIVNADSLLPKMVKYAYENAEEKETKEGEKIYEIKKYNEITDENVLNTNWKEWGNKKNITALKFSNIHNANMIQIKSRSLNILPEQELSDEQINLLARIEHNRWNIEKLLMGYRACTLAEKQDIAERTEKIEKENRLLDDKNCTEEKKQEIDKRIKELFYIEGEDPKRYYSNRFIHNDITPFQELKKDNKGIQASAYDICISKALPIMLKKNNKKLWT